MKPTRAGAIVVKSLDGASGPPPDFARRDLSRFAPPQPTPADRELARAVLCARDLRAASSTGGGQAAGGRSHLEAGGAGELVDTPERIWLPDCPDCGAPKGRPCPNPDGTPGCPHPDRMLALARVARDLAARAAADTDTDTDTDTDHHAT